MYLKPPFILLNAAKSRPVIESGKVRLWITVPVASTTCGSCCVSQTTILSVIGAELSEDITVEFGGRITTSAPTPRARSAFESSVPWLTPNSVRIMGTSTAIASTLSRVRTGRWVRLAKISLFNTSPKSNPTPPKMWPRPHPGSCHGKHLSGFAQEIDGSDGLGDQPHRVPMLRRLLGHAREIGMVTRQNKHAAIRKLPAEVG